MTLVNVRVGPNKGKRFCRKYLKLKDAEAALCSMPAWRPRPWVTAGPMSSSPRSAACSPSPRRPPPKSFDGEKGTDFCSHCGTPAPWVSRRKLVHWLKDAGSDLEPAKRLELQEIPDRIADISPDDAKALRDGKRFERSRPKCGRRPSR